MSAPDVADRSAASSLPLHVGAAASQDGETRRKEVYAELGYIDGKANSLMQLNALLLAVYGIAYGNIIEGELKASTFDIGLLLASALLCLFAIVLLLTCVVIRWEDGYWSWERVRRGRTRRYYAAWGANFASILLFASLIAWNYQKIAALGSQASQPSEQSQPSATTQTPAQTVPEAKK